MKRLRKKLNNKRGFSLAETLVAVLILLMVSAVVAEGIPAAANAYRKAVDAANAHVLLSTTVNALRGELSTARDLKSEDLTITIDGKEDTYTGVSFWSAEIGSRSMLCFKDDTIILLEYIDRDTTVLDPGVTIVGARKRDLVPQAARGGIAKDNSLKISGKIDSVTGNSVSVKDLQVKKGEQTIAAMPSSGLRIRVLTK